MKNRTTILTVAIADLIVAFSGCALHYEMEDKGNTYDFAFGLNWDGVIQDSRVEKYK